MKRNPLTFFLAFSMPIIMMAGLLLSVHAKASLIGFSYSPMHILVPPYRPYEERLFEVTTVSPYFPKPGDTFELTVSLGNYDPDIKGIVAFEIHLRFDPESVEYIDGECYFEKPFTYFSDIGCHKTRPEIILLHQCNSDEVFPKGIDELAKIKFKIKDTVVPGTLLKFPVTNYIVAYVDGQKSNLAVRVPTLYLLGDVDLDQRINTFDIISIRNHIFGTAVLTEIPLWAADIDGTGAIDIFDIIAIRDHVFQTKVISQLVPNPFPPKIPVPDDYIFEIKLPVSN